MFPFYTSWKHQKTSHVEESMYITYESKQSFLEGRNLTLSSPTAILFAALHHSFLNFF